MSDKTITRKKFDLMMSAMAHRVGMLETQGNRRLMLNEILELANITVEPKPILSGVTGGEWGYREAKKNTWEIFSPKKGSIESDGTTGDTHIGWTNRYADAQLMTGSKKLVEEIVAALLNELEGVGEISNFIKVVAQLDRMKVSLGELEGWCGIDEDAEDEDE